MTKRRAIRDHTKRRRQELPSSLSERAQGALSPDVITARGRSWITLAVLAGAVLLATVPFLDKAMHIDDHYYLQVARQILKDPWRPYDFTWVTEGRVCSVFEYDWSPPLFKYVLALGVWAFGEREVPLHAIMSVFTACVGGSMYALALRFSPRPVLATVLVILNPLFVPGQNLMLDVPMLAFGLAGLACHVWGTDRGSLRLVLTGGLLIGLAVVTKYPALIIFPLAGLYSIMKKSWLAVPAFAVAVLPIAAWCVQNLSVHGRLHFVEPVFGGRDLLWAEYGARFLSVITILGSGFVAIPFISQLSLARVEQWVLALICMVVSAARWCGTELSWPLVAGHVLFFASGFFLLVSSFVIFARRRASNDHADHVFLLVWLVVGWFSSLGAQFVAVRHLLWALPAAALVATRIILSPKTARNSTLAIGIITGALGLSVGWADWEFANITRLQVKAIVQSFSGVSWDVYFAGEHGFAYYSAQGGFEPLLDEYALEQPVVSVIRSARTASLTQEQRRKVSKYFDGFDSGRLPVVTLSRGVNFYATGVAELPWCVGPTSEVYVDIFARNAVEEVAP
jgi:hypothetical protein